jgi:two-component system OmpR family response regulator
VSTKSVHRVLIVDDDETIRLILGRTVRKAGYLARFVSNASDAIAEISAEAPDIVFTDIYMQDADGFELINWLRRRSGSIPLIAMSGANETITGQLGLAAGLGADATISKPFLEQDVLAAMALATAGEIPQWPGRRSM